MILYKAIKYRILDFCLDSFFNRIFRNFQFAPKKIDIRELNGRRYLRYIHIDWGIRPEIYENVEICEVYRYFDNKVGDLINFRLFGVHNNGTRWTTAFHCIKESSVECYI